MKKLILGTIVFLAIILPVSMKAQILNCQASFTATVDITGYNVQFTNNSLGTYTNYLWTFGDGTSSSANNPTHTYNTAGPVNACLTIWDVNGNCQSAVCDSVILGNPNGSCSASFSHQSSGSVIYFYGYSNAPGSGITFSWSFGDGDSTTGQFPVHTYANPGTYSVCLTTTNLLTGCTTVSCNPVSVSGPPACNATFTALNNGTSNALTFTSNYSTSSATYSWDFDDGTTGTGAVITHSYSSPGTYNVCLTITDPTNNCTATSCNNVTINAGPGCQASFTYNISPVFFPSVSFTDVSGGNPTSWLWVFGDGDSSTLQNPVHTYAQAGTYNVCLSIATANGCTATTCNLVTISSTGSNCNAFFGYQSAGSTYSFMTNSTGYSHNWSFGDGTTSFLASPVHTYGAPGAYQVCHTVYDLMQTCTATYCDSIFINPGGNCNASFTYTVDSANLTIALTNTSTGVLGAVVWSFGDGTASYASNPSHQYTSPGTYIVCISVTNPGTTNIICSSCQTIVVGNVITTCVPVFYSYADSNAIGNGIVHFGVFNSCPNTQFVWDFGDGSTGSGQSPTHMYNDSGWYYVCVTAFTSSGSYTSCDSVYAFRFTSSINENANAFGLVVYPNPMSGHGNAQFTLSGNAHVTAKIADMQGRIKSILLDETLSAGVHSLMFNTNDLQNGIYLVALMVNDVTIHQRISVMN